MRSKIRYQLVETETRELFLCLLNDNGQESTCFGPYNSVQRLQHDLRRFYQTGTSEEFRGGPSHAETSEDASTRVIIADDTSLYPEKWGPLGKEFFSTVYPFTDVLGADGHPWPAPLEPQPTRELIEWWLAFDNGGCEATDGCWVDNDGVCEHGHPSWALFLGLTP